MADNNKGGAIEVSSAAIDAPVSPGAAGAAGLGGGGGGADNWEVVKLSQSIIDVGGGRSEDAPLDSGVGDAGMQSQYFASDTPSTEILTVSPPTEISGKVAIVDEKQEQPEEEHGEEAKNELEAGAVESVMSPEYEEEEEVLVLPEKFRGPEFGEPAPPKTEVVVSDKKQAPLKGGPVMVRSSCETAAANAKAWVAKRLHLLRERLTVTGALCSVALVAVVTGLVIIGRRWHLERLKGTTMQIPQLELPDSTFNDEKLPDVNTEIPPEPTVPEPVMDPVPTTSPATGPLAWFESITRDFFQ